MKKNMFRFIFAFIFSICVYTLNICDIFAGSYIFENEAITDTNNQRVCFYEKISDTSDIINNGDVNKTYYAIKFEYDNKLKKYRIYNLTGARSDYFTRLWEKSTVKTGFLVRSLNGFYGGCPSNLYYTNIDKWSFSDDFSYDPEKKDGEEIRIIKKFKLVNSKSCSYNFKNLGEESNNGIVYHVLANNKTIFESNSEKIIDDGLKFVDFRGQNGVLDCPENLDAKINENKITINIPKTGTSGNVKIDNEVSNVDAESNKTGNYIFGNEAITDTYTQRVCFYRKTFDGKSVSESDDEFPNLGIDGVEDTIDKIENAYKNGNVDPTESVFYAIRFQYNDTIQKYMLYHHDQKYDFSHHFARLSGKPLENGLSYVDRLQEYKGCPQELYYGKNTWSFMEGATSSIEKKYTLENSMSCRYDLDDIMNDDTTSKRLVVHALESGRLFPETNAKEEINIDNLFISDFRKDGGSITCPESLNGKINGDEIVISAPKDGTSGNLKIDNAVSNTDDDSSFNSSNVTVGCKNGEGTEIGSFEMKKSDIPGSNVSNIKIETAGYLRDTCSITVTGGNKYTEKIGGPWCKTDNYYLTNTELSNGDVSFKVYSCGSNVEETEVEIPTNICPIYSKNNNLRVEFVGSLSDKKILSAYIEGCGNAKFINASYDEIFSGQSCKENVYVTVDTDKCYVVSNRYIHTTGKRICGIFKENGKLIGVVKNLYAILRISIPVLILCLTIVEFLKVLFSGEGKTMKEAFKATVSRFILLAVVVLLPFIISFITRLAGIYDTCYKFFI